MKRELAGKWVWVARAVAIALVTFHLYTAGAGPLPDMRQRAVHVALGFILTFALFSPTKKVEQKIPVYDLVLMGITLACCVNVFIKYYWFHTHYLWFSLPDITMGILMLLLSVEAARRTTGWVFPIFITLAVLYALIGSIIPGIFGHKGFDFIVIIQDLYQTTKGIWGTITGISANVVSIFLIFGAFLLFSGGGATFHSSGKLRFIAQSFH
ncbi:hypothetical protein ES703_122222 [subsurface metagenome]